MKKYYMKKITCAKEMMKDSFRKMLEKTRDFAESTGKRIGSAAKRLKTGMNMRKRLSGLRAFAAKYGYYGCLALLLVVLGMASNAYRNRDMGESRITEPDEYVKANHVVIPEILPTATPEPALPEYCLPVEGDILNAFSPESLVWNETLSMWRTHPAVDISANAGESVVSCSDGRVSDAYSDPMWGNVIVIDHEDGNRSVYANLNTLNLVTVGQNVKMGDIISAVGNSAACEADMPWHLHFELLNKDGVPEDISKYINAGE
ncbi:MAG: M23 family metallopeptidase [Clostridiales bacterium]|nr:M23 family metallopeptidase [Clostridiales bacterium]